ncbi:hypothetical protein ASPZODRAFT_151541 [Penicilliopsis zonata CBS 506.65]|uniref:DUF7600 domain-containing protein n=1 Tax=Penicilliopsis zonata CBS 506.65 TaxID=1073090 RepID=A0A1L9SIM6_9EURO|nr:hypothetical protein ASPZODRAFT_151541 [Penicilliopsis zonata CBS 506.65]OJJ46951.1 hypothetical protein ASPZODRAFT_151541 [Penicilliopsis zonata CBS 506.65]
MDIHRCRFMPYNPQAINALAFSHPPSAGLAGRGVPTLRLAVGRANGDIEIWNPLRGAWVQETVLRGGKDRSIEGLAWTLDPPEDGPDGGSGSSSKLPGRLRLFSIGYSTTVTEWDLEQGRPLRHSSGNHGEIWCLAAQPRWQPTQRGKDGKWLPPAEGEFTGQNLAAGCADGSIVIFSTANEELSFLRLMRPSTKRARVLSVTFQNRHTIVAGYADSSIRLFDIRSGQLLRTISLGKGPNGGAKELLVWSVKCLPDGTIVSGDSAGEIRFWDGKNYALIQRLSGHLADVLDVAVSADGETVISGGADQRTVVYRKKDSEKGDKKARWAEVMHRRYHSHDVKAFAVYETRDISIAVSGGPDAAPVVLPLREFGKEHHRKLSSLPQIPQLSSSPSSRLVMSFWDREISIWRMLRGPTSANEATEGKRHRLVGKVLIQGEENITSAVLSSDGKILAVATISNVKVFAVRRRKGDERGVLRIQKLDIPPELAEEGARVLNISPDSRWLCVVRPNSDVYLARFEIPAVSTEKPQILPQLVKVNRVSRHTRHEKASHGTLGHYERTIRCVVFSDDSKILASGDLSGCVDTWVLKTRGMAGDSDDESDDDDDEQTAIDGERWCQSATESPIPRLKSGVVLMSFRPQGRRENEDRLMVLTSEHQLIEFEALDGKLSDWSRRNPKAYLPAEFRGVKDRAMGWVWDLFGNRERLWLYGTSWLWMFDLSKDFPSPEELESEAGNTNDQLVKASASQKRKRELLEEEERERKKPNSGAGDRIPHTQADISIGTKIRKITGNDDSQGVWVSLERERPRAAAAAADEEEEEDALEHDEAFATANEADMARLRRENPDVEATGTPQKQTPARHNRLLALIDKVEGTPSRKLDELDVFASPAPQPLIDLENAAAQANRQWWHTYKYRDILGIVPLSLLPQLDNAGHLSDDSVNSTHLEVAVVERPMWDVELPGRYIRCDSNSALDGRPFLTGVGARVPRHFSSIAAPSDPTSQWSDEGFVWSKEDVFPTLIGIRGQPQPGFVFHDACWQLLQRILHPHSVDVECLYDLCLSCPANHKGWLDWGHTYGELMERHPVGGYPWEDVYITGFVRRYLLSNKVSPLKFSKSTPLDAPEIRRALAECRVSGEPGKLEGICSISVAFRQAPDCFQNLPQEILEAIQMLLPSQSVANARLAARSFATLPLTQTFWASRFDWEQERGFCIEARHPSFSPASEQRRRDWKDLYERTALAGLPSGQQHNRMRVWRCLRDLASLLLECPLTEPGMRRALQPPHEIGIPDPNWRTVGGDFAPRTTTGAAAPAGMPCRVIYEQIVSVPSKVKSIAVSFRTFANTRYISGLRFVLDDDAQDLPMGYVVPSSEAWLCFDADGSDLTGLIVAVGPRGIKALRAVTSHGAMSAWAGSPDGLPQTVRLCMKDAIHTLKGCFDGFKMVSLSVPASMQPLFPSSTATTYSLRSMGLWYPTPPPTHLNLHDDCFAGCAPRSSSEYRPLVLVAFGGVQGSLLPHLDRLSVTVSKAAIVGVDFFYTQSSGLPCLQACLSTASQDESNKIPFSIDGPGGERLTGLHCDSSVDRGVTSLKVSTTYNRSFTFQPSAVPILKLPTDPFIPQRLKKASIPTGETLTGVYFMHDPRFGMLGLGPISEDLNRQVVAPSIEEEIWKLSASIFLQEGY